jgi:hypothetical protein
MNINSLPLNRANADFDFDQFMDKVRWLVDHHQTTGNNPSKHLFDFTSLNLKRMERINKTMNISPETEDLLKESSLQHWIVISEAWCGDSAQNLPVIAAMAKASSGKIKLTIILRDQYPEWMEHYHTDGTHSIPKLVVFDHQGNQLFTWGPRPAEAQEIVKEWKRNQDTVTKDQMEVTLHTWYAKNRGMAVQEELTTLIRNFHPAEIKN